MFGYVVVLDRWFSWYAWVMCEGLRGGLCTVKTWKNVSKKRHIVDLYNKPTGET